MYATGTPFDFEQRLHEMPLTSGDLQSNFLVEGQNYIGTFLHTAWTGIPVSGPNYTGVLSHDLAVRWDREYTKKQFSLLGVPTTGGYFI